MEIERTVLAGFLGSLLLGLGLGYMLGYFMVDNVAKNKVHKMETVINSLRAQINDLESSLRSCHSNVEDLQYVLDEKQQTIDNLKAVYNECREELQEKKDDIEVLRSYSNTVTNAATSIFSIVQYYTMLHFGGAEYIPCDTFDDEYYVIKDNLQDYRDLVMEHCGDLIRLHVAGFRTRGDCRSEVDGITDLLGFLEEIRDYCTQSS